MVNFALPFKGEWFTFWGGETIELNYHFDHPTQKYAFDFCIRDTKASFDGDRFENANYYCFGKEVIAPADGEVVQVVDGVFDNIPGYRFAFWLYGNTVIIKHTPNVYSVLAHFKQHSIVVKPGDTVKQGDLLGLCGNSGHSSEAHIHFHLQDRLERTSLAEGVKCTFSKINVKQNGEFAIKENYMPIKGDIVCNF